MPTKVIVYGLSDIGLVRQNNEDVWAQCPDANLFLLADGMGGHRAGEVAAREAIDAVIKAFQTALSKTKKRHKNLLETKALLSKAIEQGNQAVYKLSCQEEALRGMGTTLCCLHFHEEGVIYAHVGDSRIYCLREKKLTQLTRDHSLLRELIDLGQIEEQRVPDFHYKNIITKAIGTEPTVVPAIDVQETKQGDRYLMCSDGLSDLLSLKEMEALLNQTPDNKKALEELILIAKERGGHDNITVVLVECVR